MVFSSGGHLDSGFGTKTWMAEVKAMAALPIWLVKSEGVLALCFSGGAGCT